MSAAERPIHYKKNSFPRPVHQGQRPIWPQKPGQGGFTLIEVLIATVLLAMLMLVLTSALHSMGQTETRIEQRVADSDDQRTAAWFLRDALGQVSARRFDAGAGGGPASAIFFNARADTLEWIGVMPARYGLGGRHYLRLALERGADGQGALVLRYAPWNGAPSFANWAQAPAQVLAQPVDGLALAYHNPASGQWQPSWPAQQDPAGAAATANAPPLLPNAVRLDLAGPAWPSIIVAVRELPDRPLGGLQDW